MHPYHSVPYTILETFPPTCARYFLFMLSGLGSVAWQSSAVRWYSPGARLSPCRMWFYWVLLSLGASSQRCPVVTSGVTLSLVLHHQNSLLTETFGPGACFNGCFACLKAANLFFGCFCDALGMLGRVVSPACKMDRATSPSATGLLERTASAAWSHRAAGRSQPHGDPLSMVSGPFLDGKWQRWQCFGLEVLL